MFWWNKLSKPIRIFVLLVLTVICIAIVFFGWSKLRQKNNTKSDSPTLSQPNEITVTQDEADLAEINKLYSNQEFNKALPLAKSYGLNTSNVLSMRYNALLVCIDSANKQEDKDSKEQCYKEAKIILDSEIDEFTKSKSIETLEAVYSGSQIDQTNGVEDSND